MKNESGKKKVKTTNQGELIRTKRKKKNLSQGEFAAIVDMNPQQISNIERGLCEIPTHRLSSLVRYRICSRDELVEAVIKDFEEFLKTKLG